jgi:hypothetical protein
MKHLMMISTKVSTILLLLIFVAFFAAPTFGMELSTAQKELWSGIQAGWEVWKKGDMEAMETWEVNFHEDYVWWHAFNLFPKNRAEWAKALSSFKIKSFKLEPYEVRIVGNVAIVQYYWRITIPNGKVFPGRISSTYIKQDGKWKALGGMSASCSYPVSCLK